VGDFRYAQYCPLARASEILAERWTLPVLRELFTGPQRFTDLLRRLPGVSTSVLSTRLARLVQMGVVRQKELPPPAATTVYELTGRGRALEPALVELVRWGIQFLEPPRRGDHFEPEWLPLGLRALARRDATPSLAFELRVLRDGAPPLAIRVAGSARGTRVSLAGPRADAVVTAPPLTLLGLASGALDARAALADGSAGCEGDPRLLTRLPELFDASVAPAASRTRKSATPRPRRTRT
jgi:DNA-binding HxlR family transcriptional regulator